MEFNSGFKGLNVRLCPRLFDKAAFTAGVTMTKDCLTKKNHLY